MEIFQIRVIFVKSLKTCNELGLSLKGHETCEGR